MGPCTGVEAEDARFSPIPQRAYISVGVTDKQVLYVASVSWQCRECYGTTNSGIRSSECLKVITRETLGTQVVPFQEGAPMLMVTHPTLLGD